MINKPQLYPLSNLQKEDRLSWPPEESDFLKVARWASTQRDDFKTVLVYVNYSPEEPILIYDPVHIGPGPKESRTLTVTYKKSGKQLPINVILAEDD